MCLPFAHLLSGFDSPALCRVARSIARRHGGASGIPQACPQDDSRWRVHVLASTDFTIDQVVEQIVAWVRTSHYRGVHFEYQSGTVIECYLLIGFFDRKKLQARLDGVVARWRRAEWDMTGRYGDLVRKSAIAHHARAAYRALRHCGLDASRPFVNG